MYSLIHLFSLLLVSVHSIYCSLPEFEAVYSISENEPVGTVIATVSDSMKPGFVRHSDYFYSLEGGGDRFNLDPRTSVLKTSAPLDVDELCYQEECSDSKAITKMTVNVMQGSQLMAVIRLKLEIQDQNDNQPIFRPNVIKKRLKELVFKKGTEIDLERAYDDDINPQYKKILYSLKEKSDMFSLKLKKDGRPTLVLNKDLDYEMQSEYNLELLAWNPGKEFTNSTLKIIIEVLNMNDNPPRFSQKIFKVTISEDTKPNSLIFTLKAEDADKDPVKITMRSNVDRSTYQTFLIESDGRVYLNKQLNYEKRSQYELPVQASDGELQDEAQLVISVTDVNDEPPSFKLNPSVLSVEENKAANILVGQVIISDADTKEINGPVYCEEPAEVRGKQALRFDPSPNISPALGKYDLYTRRTFDRETSYSGRRKGVIISRLICADQGTPENRLTSTLTASLIIRDLNDNPPEFSRQIYQDQIKENNRVGMKIRKMSSIDPDEGENARLSFSLLNEKENFRIDETSGDLTAAIQFDREKRSNYAIRVQAVDHGKPQLTATTLINLTIIDVNDHVPELMGPHSFVILENLKPGHLIGHLNARDLDINENGKVMFSLNKSPSSQKFRLLQNGTLYSSVSFDREDEDEYCLEVELKDMAPVNSFSQKVAVCVKIQDVNDNSPIFEFPQGPGVGSKDKANASYIYKLSVHESPGFRVLVAKATDKDAGQNAAITYRMDPSRPEGLELFSLDSMTGELKLARSLARTHLGVHSVRVFAEDGGHPKRSTKRTLHILIEDVPPKGNSYDSIDSQSSIGGRNVMIVIILSSVSAFLASVLIAAILCMIRPWHHRRQPAFGPGQGNDANDLFLSKMGHIDGGGGILMKGMPDGMQGQISSYLPGQFHHQACQLGPPDHNWPSDILMRGEDKGNYYTTERSHTPGYHGDVSCEQNLLDEEDKLSCSVAGGGNMRGNGSGVLSSGLISTTYMPRGTLGRADQCRFRNYESGYSTSYASNHPGNGLCNGEEQQSDSGRGGSEEDINTCAMSSQRFKKGNTQLQTFQPTSLQNETSFCNPRSTSSMNYTNTVLGPSYQSSIGSLPRNSNLMANTAFSPSLSNTMTLPRSHETNPLSQQLSRLNNNSAQKQINQDNCIIFKRGTVPTPFPVPVTGTSSDASPGRQPNKTSTVPQETSEISSEMNKDKQLFSIPKSTAKLTQDTSLTSDVNGSRVDPEKLCNEIDQLFFNDMI